MLCLLFLLGFVVGGDQQIITDLYIACGILAVLAIVLISVTITAALVIIVIVKKKTRKKM